VKRFTAALALALMFSASAGAADIAQLTSPINGMNGIAVSGIIEADDWKKLEELANKISDYDHTLVVLRSPGGNAAVGITMGDFIHKTGISTLVPDNDTCASLCAFIWLGGARRFLYPNSHIGFHGIYNAAGEVDHDAGIVDAMMGVYLGHLGFSYAAAVWMLSPPVRSIHWLREAEAKKFGIRYESLASIASSAPAPTPTPAPTPPPAGYRPSSTAYASESPRWNFRVWSYDAEKFGTYSYFYTKKDCEDQLENYYPRGAEIDRVGTDRDYAKHTPYCEFNGVQ
jgi:hypothetical protein